MSNVTKPANSIKVTFNAVDHTKVIYTVKIIIDTVIIIAKYKADNIITVPTIIDDSFLLLSSTVPALDFKLWSNDLAIQRIYTQKLPKAMVDIFADIGITTPRPGMFFGYELDALC